VMLHDCYEVGMSAMRKACVQSYWSTWKALNPSWEMEEDL
jgi:hypothetical protein